ncbi:MAG: Mov34/MPN/PAD-1 family protein [Rhodothermales bacterium]
MTTTESAPVTATKLVFARSGGGRVQLGPSALYAIRRHLQLGLDAAEAGGVLLGRYIAGTADVVVDAVTEPMAGDRRSRARFFRHRRGHQLAIKSAWSESGGTSAWLGEWHTHPEPDPSPSFIDRLDWRRKLTVDRYEEALFFLIAGTDRLRAWEGARHRRVYALPHFT